MRTTTHSRGMGEFSGASGSMREAERSEEVSRLVQKGIALAASSMYACCVNASICKHSGFLKNAMQDCFQEKIVMTI